MKPTVVLGTRDGQDGKEPAENLAARSPALSFSATSRGRGGEVPGVVRQVKPGRGGSDVDSRRQSGNLSDGTRQVRTLPGKGWPPAGSESCVGLSREGACEA